MQGTTLGTGGAGDGKAVGRRLISPEEFEKTYRVLRSELETATGGPGRWALVGVKRRGAALGRRLWKDLRARHPDLDYGEVDISLYRDDYHLQEGHPQVLGTEISFAVDDASLLLIDDVLFTGRTVRAAMDLILDFGRPRRIWLAVFVDRGHRELPIAADFVGCTLETSREDRVMVRLREVEGGDDAVELLPAAGDRRPEVRSRS
ncbi:MAG: bifunctional pyr operon transcriptional regulator/uracil phosphoribosyltransferase PyrR [Planctomycetes bacterium]|nr:bifunctional pyr operon transcriptional regulator/uracil phosphoribosyltransferase PyrR [Planctomycetota bacterium]